MKILLLGGNGYLGSKVARALLGTGNNVVCTTWAFASFTRIRDVKNRLILILACRLRHGSKERRCAA